MKHLFTFLILLVAVAPLLYAARAYAEQYMVSHLTGRDVHIDRPLSNIAVEAFSGGNFVAPLLFPVVGVQKQSDGYYILDKAAWLRTPQTTLRAPKTAPRRIEFTVSTDTYFAHNFALAGENAFEVIANADDPIQLRARTVRLVVETLMRDMEVRVANKVTSISNVGSGVALSGAAKWSNYLGSDPVADVTTGHAFIRQTTGMRANTMLLDFDTHQVLRRHPVLLDMYKYTQGGLLNDAELKEVFRVERIIISDGIRNTNIEGGTASIANIWGNTCLLAVVQPGMSLQTATFGLGMRWTPPELPAPMQARVYNDPDPGKKVEIVEVGYYQDEKIVARDLSYVIKDTL
jgi:hypothetical protein